MRRRFIAINHNRDRIIILGAVIIISIILLLITLKWLLKGLKQIFISRDEQINMLNLGTSNVKIIDLNLLDPNDILSVSLNLKKDNTYKLKISTNDENNNPLVYIYNTYDSQKYSNKSVVDASLILHDELAYYKIPSYVENKSVSEYLYKNNISKNRSYEISRIFIDEYWRENELLKYFIDIHISDATYDVTTAKIDDDSYAKVLFIVNMDNKFYDSTLEFASVINSMLDKRLSRGIMKKTDANNYFNQDMDAKCLLIELGGYENNMVEVENTLKILGEILYQYMSEGYNGD